MFDLNGFFIGNNYTLRIVLDLHALMKENVNPISRNQSAPVPDLHCLLNEQNYRLHIVFDLHALTQRQMSTQHHVKQEHPCLMCMIS